ncbi:hypothetical protein J6590_077996 [Homalodisca vitripennis]|nr:hypothetical protein J6590_077996 [Homalodisca vitripennis]
MTEEGITESTSERKRTAKLTAPVAPKIHLSYTWTPVQMDSIVGTPTLAVKQEQLAQQTMDGRKKRADDVAAERSSTADYHWN